MGLLQPMSLQESADKCLKSLQGLKEGATRRRQSHKTSSAQDLLQSFEQSIDGNLRSLQAWITQIKKGEHTNNDEIVISIRRMLGSLQQYIKDADSALRSRLRHRRIYLIGFIRSKKLVWVLVRAILPANDFLGRGSKIVSPGNCRTLPTLSAR